MSLRKFVDTALPPFEPNQARVLFFRPENSTNEEGWWEDITDEVKESLRFEDGVVELEVRHFSG